MKKLILIHFLFAFSLVNAQNILSLEDALSLALKNNHDISIAKNEALISEINNTAGSAGMLPTIGLTGTGSYSLKDVSSRETQTDAYAFTRSGTSMLNAGAELSWTLFDGGKMFVTRSKLREIEALGEIQFKDQVLQTMSEVISAYYNIVKQKQQLAAINQSINYNIERVRIAETAYKNGLKDKTGLLQAKIDLNVNRENAISQEAAILNAQRELARLLVLENDTTIVVSSEMTFTYQPDRMELQKKLFDQNTGIMALQKQLEIEKLIVEENTRLMLPKVSLNSGYYFQNTTNHLLKTDAISSGITVWPQIGGSVSIPVFLGGNLKRKVALSKVDVAIARTALESLKSQIGTELNNAFTEFENQQKLLEIEKENYELVKENLEISLQQMRLGEATSLEVRMAQSDFEQSATRLTNFSFLLKMVETKLKRLMGEL